MNRVAFVVMLLLGSLRVATAAEAPAAAFKVIVNPGVVAGAKIPRDVLAQIYFGKARIWSDGSGILPVDLSTMSPVRRAFSQSVLRVPVDGVKQHWLRNANAGSRPPVVKDSDAAVIAFVASERGAVGYVSEGAELPTTVRVLLVE